MPNSFDARSSLAVGDRKYEIYRLQALDDARYEISGLPYSLKILLENLLRREDGESVRAEDIEALAGWQPTAPPQREIAFNPARVLMQDFTGVPAIVDLAAMRDAMAALGGDPDRINPLAPVELVIDHSVQVDIHNRPDALERNTAIEFERNRERYGFLRWGQQAFDNLQVVPPNTGIVHQINLERLARVVFENPRNGVVQAYPDTLVGTDSHTTMINGLGVLGWGVGGIEAEAAMLGQPLSMLIPQVVGFELSGGLAEGATATDLVLTITQMLRQHGVVGKFVEFYGEGLERLPLADRATIANMAPEYGATCGLFPIDRETLSYLRLSGRTPERLALIEAYAREQGLWRQPGDAAPRYLETLRLDMETVEPCLAGPRQPQDRIPLRRVRETCRETVRALRQDSGNGGGNGGGSGGGNGKAAAQAGRNGALRDGAVAIAAITSCTNTSNPSVMIGAGLLARKARERGLKTPPWVKTSLAPGSMVVRNYLERAELIPHLEALGFHIVGFGCTTCIGNSGPLPEPVSQAIAEGDLAVAAVLSGNRNFEGRIHPQVRMNFLASPPLVVAYALAGTMDIDLQNDPLGGGKDGRPVYLRDIWPSQAEIRDTIAATVDPAAFREGYRDLYAGDKRWATLEAAADNRYRWREDSTYVRRPPFFEALSAQPPAAPGAIRGARLLALLGDGITTDHISPAGAIRPDDPAGRYLLERGVERRDFNSYGARRGNHEVMMRGTFANIRLRNRLAPGREGGWTTHAPSGREMHIYEAAMRYREEQTPLLVIAGQRYGTGSSRDWAAKGARLLGVRAVLAGSFERIHRANLVGMGVLPLVFADGSDAESLGIAGTEEFDIEGLTPGASRVTVVMRDGEREHRFPATVRIDTPKEWDYYRNDGILPYVLRRLAAS